MKHKTMANLLRTVIFILGLCGVFMHLWWIPGGASLFFIMSKWWIILMNVALIPCWVVLVIAWRIADSIAREQEFCYRNARHFRLIFILALADSVFFIAGSAVLVLLHLANIWCVLVTVPLGALGVCVAICAAVMSHLIDKAAFMQEDVDLTI